MTGGTVGRGTRHAATGLEEDKIVQNNRAAPRSEKDGVLVYHKYKVGQTVHFAGGMKYATNVRGTYKVTRLLPTETDDRQYRVQSAKDGHERVVRESEIEAV